MSGFSAHRLQFEARAESLILLGQHQGSAIRGALFQALRGGRDRPGFCLEPLRRDCHGCIALGSCPVSFLLATVDRAGRRGSDVPRPYTVEPPLHRHGRYEAGQPFRFGLTMFARSLELFPYVVVGVRRMGEQGIGRGLQAGKEWRAGRFGLVRISAINPLGGQEQGVLQSGDQVVRVPAVPITRGQVLSRAKELEDGSRIRLEFLTPTRITESGHALKRPEFRPLFHRLLERLSSLWEEYGGEELPIDFPELMRRAEKIQLVDDQSHWEEVRGYSTRQGAAKELNGFVGQATYEGEFQPLLPWLVWGEITHVGKDAVKGCGMYRIFD